MIDPTLDVPLGVSLLNHIPHLKALPLLWKTRCHKFNVLLLTFLSYASYHLARKPTSVVKNVLHYRNCSTANQKSDANHLDENWCHWAPFDGENADTLLGALDSSFLFAYAFGMYLMGPLAERLNLRWFLSFGMISSGLFGALFGVAYFADIHSLTYFIIIQVLAGLCQSTGWPACVAVVGNWFGKSKRGLIMGVWRSHHSVGNIFGTLLAALFVEWNWGLSFVVPSALITGLGILMFLFLVNDPRAVGCPSPDHCGTNDPKKDEPSLELSEKRATSPDNNTLTDFPSPEETEVAISFKRALAIPGVVEYSLCLFFTKFINYTFLYWLPRFIQETRLDMGAKSSADLSTLFDIGGIVGGILAGLISDVTSASAITCAAAFLLSFPMLFIYQSFASASVTINVVLLFITGLLVNGPYALITTAVSADLGTHPDFRGSARALATVTAIIDATGSIGAALGPLMAGPLSRLGWEYVFYAMMAANTLGLLMLTRLVIKEAKKMRNATDKRSVGDSTGQTVM